MDPGHTETVTYSEFLAELLVMNSLSCCFRAGEAEILNLKVFLKKCMALLVFGFFLVFSQVTFKAILLYKTGGNSFTLLQGSFKLILRQFLVSKG